MLTVETRHVIVASEQGLLSLPCSLHAGACTGDYKFIWAITGDNFDYTSMDIMPAEALL